MLTDQGHLLVNTGSTKMFKVRAVYFGKNTFHILTKMLTGCRNSGLPVITKEYSYPGEDVIAILAIKRYNYPKRMATIESISRWIK